MLKKIFEGAAGRSALVIGGMLFILGAALGYGSASMRAFAERTALLASVYPLRSADSSLPLIHALVAYETPEAVDFKEYVSLKEHVQNVILDLTAAGVAETVSVYYRNLKTARWIAIDKNARYYPASLLKVPVLIAYYKQRESDPNLFDEYVTYKRIGSGNKFEAESTLEVGRSYTVRELLERMIIDSDNGATYTLLSQIDENTLAEVYSDLGIEDPGDDSSRYQISSKMFALFFRILYNATYLSPKASEEALELLTRTTYMNGLVAGVPEGIKIAHKWGEHVVSERGGVPSEELHDCGIIYLPEHPYLLCVMTRAATLEAAESVIASISKTVYEAVKSESD